MASQILTVVDEVISKLVSISADAGLWSAEVRSAYGDWAATRAPILSYDSVVERKDLVNGELTIFVGFGFREPFQNSHDRCQMSHIYPIGVGVYQRFRAPGTESALGINGQIARSDIDLHLQFSEELQSILYSQNLDNYYPQTLVEASTNPEAIKKQYLETVMLLNYTAK